MARIRFPNPGAKDGNYLAASEDMVTSVRVHWAVLFVPASILTGSILLAIAADVVAHTALLWVLVIPVLGWFLWQLWEWTHQRVMITNKRILRTSGIITRRVATMPLEKVTDLMFERDLMGRSLGYGTFVVESAGQDQSLRRIEYLPRPNRLYLTLCDMMFGDGPSPQPLPPDPEDTRPIDRRPLPGPGGGDGKYDD